MSFSVILLSAFKNHCDPILLYPDTFDSGLVISFTFSLVSFTFSLMSFEPTTVDCSITPEAFELVHGFRVVT